MSRFIEEFYYGNIDPQARSTKENKTVQKQMEVLMNNEDLLTNALTDKPKKEFLRLLLDVRKVAAQCPGSQQVIIQHPVMLLQISSPPLPVNADGAFFFGR